MRLKPSYHCLQPFDESKQECIHALETARESLDTLLHAHEYDEQLEKIRELRKLLILPNNHPLFSSSAISAIQAKKAHKGLLRNVEAVIQQIFFGFVNGG